MSATPLRAPRARPAAPTRPRPRLRLVRTPAPERTRVPFLLLCTAILGGSLLGALGLNTAMATTAYEIGDKQQQLADLTQEQQILTSQHESVSSPQQVAAAALALGMVRAEGLSFIHLADGTITGPASELVTDGEG